MRTPAWPRISVGESGQINIVGSSNTFFLVFCSSCVEYVWHTLCVGLLSPVSVTPPVSLTLLVRATLCREPRFPCDSRSHHTRLGQFSPHMDTTLARNFLQGAEGPSRNRTKKQRNRRKYQQLGNFKCSVVHSYKSIQSNNHTSGHEDIIFVAVHGFFFVTIGLDLFWWQCLGLLCWQDQICLNLGGVGMSGAQLWGRKKRQFYNIGWK